MTNAEVGSSQGGAFTSAWRLKLLVFVSGAVLMALEMAGSRVLAAHFGSSIYVWGSIIGIFLAALSGGYFVGGLVSDKRPSFLLLNLLVLAAGCWLLVLPLYGNYVCRVIRSANLGARLEPLLATTILFGGPSLLMGMVSPFAVRLAASAIDRIGNTAGRLYAISTVGSIAGTLVTAFWLIPMLGVNTILRSLGVALIVMAIIGLPRSRTTAAIAVAVVIIALPAMFLKAAPFVSLRADQHVRFEGDSPYHHVLVVDDDRLGARLLRFNNHIQSIIDQKPPFASNTYTNSFELVRIFKPKLKRVLFIGGGGAVGPRNFLESDPNVIIDLVEIDPVVVDLSHNYFHLQNDSRLNTYVEEGRRFVRRTKEKYDAVILDAFTAGGQVPFHLATKEFLEEVKNVLTPDGIFLSNITSALAGPKSQILRAEYKTARDVFPAVLLFPKRYDNDAAATSPEYLGKPRNTMLVGLNNSAGWNAESIAAAAAALLKLNAVHSPTFAVDAANLHQAPIKIDDVPLLTDDYAPVDTMVF